MWEGFAFRKVATDKHKSQTNSVALISAAATSSNDVYFALEREKLDVKKEKKYKEERKKQQDRIKRLKKLKEPMTEINYLSSKHTIICQYKHRKMEDTLSVFKVMIQKFREERRAKA